MRVEIVSFTGDSGLTDYSVSLARALAKLVVTCVVTAESLPARFENMGFAVERVFRRSRHYPIDIFRFAMGVLKRKPDWIILQGPLKFPFIDGLIVRFLRLLGVQAAITVHDVLPHYPRIWSRATYGFYYRSFEKVIVHSNAALKGVCALGVHQEILTVPHGIYDIFDLTGLSQSEARSKIKGMYATDFVILFFGHLETRKGLMEFLDSAELLKFDASIKFLIAGGNSLSKQGQEYVDRLNAAKGWENVVIVDERIPFEDVENYFSASDLVALPYLEGTTSGVLKLALAFNKPVVATRVGDFPEQIPNGAGEVIETSDISNDLVKSIIKIKENYSEYMAAMASASSDAQWPDIAKKIHTFLS